MRGALALAAALLLLAGAALAFLLASVPRPVVPAQEELRIERVTLIEPGRGRRESHTLTIRAGRIASIEPSADGAGGPWDGAFVLPGLVDLHVHLPPRLLTAELRAVLLLFLAHGVTTVRDAGSPWGWSLSVRGEVASGRLPGPRVLSCGPLIAAVEGWPGAVVIEDVSEVDAVFGELVRDGVDCVKVFDTLSPAVATALRERAHASGLRLIGHVPSASERLLLDEVQHLTGLTSALRTRHPAALAEAVADSLAAEVQHTPTLVVLDRFARAPEGRLACGGACRALPRYLETVLWDPRRVSALEAMVSDLGFAPRERFEAAKEVVGALHRGGVEILAGTDSPTYYNPPGASLHEEIALLYAAGLSPEDALAAATTRAAEALGDAQPGRLEPGARADLVLLRSDPIDAIARGLPLDVVAVVADGRLYERDWLDAQLAAYEKLFEDSLYGTWMETALRALLPEREARWP